METITKKKKKKLNLVIPIIIAVIIVVGLWIWNFYALYELGDTKRGTFGDMFGSVNAIFSGLAFAGIIITIYIQSHELKLQRKELKLTRKEAKLTRGEFALQNKTLKIQRFENTFFEMLSLFNSIVNTVQITEGKDIIITGRKAIYKIIGQLENEARNYSRTVDFLKRKDGLTTITAVETRLELINLNDVQLIYHDIYDEYNDILGHYFRTFYHIIKLIDSTDIVDKQRYVSIARAQLSNAEQLLLFYNCLHKNGNEKFKPLVEKYALLNNLDHNYLLSEHIAAFYNESAYGED